MMEAPMACPACASATRVMWPAHPAYRDSGATYAICQCLHCGTSAAFPRVVPDDLYDAIYRQTALIPGYARYEDYAERVANAVDPLAALADCEDMYWGIATALAALGGPARVPRVLDIGCGLGYLTYALVKAGYSEVGLDASGAAIAGARARYGDLFVHGSLQEHAMGRDAGYGVAIMAELLEHVAEPRVVLEEAWRVVRPGGALIVTTPNRSAFAPGVLWETDPPPVHLSWFTEDGVRRLGDQLGARTTFVDFTPFSATHPSYRRSVPTDQPTRRPVLSPDSRPLQAPWVPSWWRRTLLALPGGRWGYGVLQQMKARRRVAGPQRETLVAVLHRPL